MSRQDAKNAKGSALDLFQVVRPDGTLIDPAAPVFPLDELKRLYRAMALIRAVDTRMLALQRQGRIGFYGLTTGEEAAVVGSGAALRPADWVFPALRQGGVALLRGYSLARLTAQNIGNSADLLKGRQMPCHYSDRAVNFVSWSSCIGTQIPHAVGAAYAARLLKQDTIAVAYLGDGATSSPEFHVAMNFAAVWKAPVLFLCQNNQWAISVPFAAQTASVGIAEKASAYGMPGVRVDGNDVIAVYMATREAAERARRGDGPTLIEAVTFRRGGHSSSDDPSRYRDAALVGEWEKKDPIDRGRKHLESRKAWSAKDEQAMQEEFKVALDRAIAEAESAGPPGLETLFDDVCAALPPNLVEQRAALLDEERRRGRGERGGGEFPL
ncbi:MAG: thiamine pyrophosphate-dependent dehydrogenase E1 component subunit alpha [Planctomycetes bacterium]|nr:thiamine pyrophosphate-dependent dehydrogenase E1 component subunit alpha [Planctomycetota bacterium]